jgi:diguanylate cyclase (GGDEF)-like protein
MKRLISIRTKLIVAFMVFSVIPMGFVASHLYRHASSRIKSATIEHLEELTKLKADEITRYFDQVKVDLVTAQDFVTLRANAPVLVALKDRPHDPRFVAAKKMIDIQMVKYAADHHLNDIDIISPEGAVIYSDDMDDIAHIERETHSTEALMREGRKGIYFTDVFNREENGHKTSFMYASAPLHDLRDTFVGIIVFEITLDQFFKHIQETTGLGKSGETLMVKQSGDSIRFLNPLRYKLDPANSLIKIGSSRAVPGQMSMSGKAGTGIVPDYRGVEVVAAWRAIPAVAWGIVVKTDTAEALAPAIELRDDLLAAGTLAFTLGVLFSFWLAHSMSQPIRALQEAAEELGHGNLEYQVPVESNDEIGQLSRTFNRMVLNLREITASRDQIRHLANHDTLTGLPNRLLLEDRLQQALIEGRREDELVAVMFLDLDGFKAVNDTYGHDAGDVLLKQVAIRLLHCVRERDTVARLGGDEFVIIFINVKEISNIALIASKVIRSFEKSFDISGFTLNISTSIGVSLYPQHAAVPDELMQLADEAMYQAKRSGKNRYCLADPGQMEPVPDDTAEAAA